MLEDHVALLNLIPFFQKARIEKSEASETLLIKR